MKIETLMNALNLYRNKYLTNKKQEDVLLAIIFIQNIIYIHDYLNNFLSSALLSCHYLHMYFLY